MNEIDALRSILRKELIWSEWRTGKYQDVDTAQAVAERKMRSAIGREMRTECRGGA